MKDLMNKWEEKLSKADRLHCLQKTGIKELVVLLCIIADAFTLFTVFDLMLTQQVTLTWVITATVAAVMNIAPMLLAAGLRNDKMGKRMRIVQCTASGLIFLTFFVLTLALRFQSRDLLFATTSGLSILGDAGSMVTAESGPTLAQSILAILMGFEPLGTSVVCFILAYEDDPNQKKHLETTKYINTLEEKIQNNKTAMNQLDAYMKIDLEEQDNEMYDAMRKQVMNYGEMAKRRARVLLAEKAGKPEAVSWLMEDKHEYEDSKNNKHIENFKSHAA